MYQHDIYEDLKSHTYKNMPDQLRWISITCEVSLLIPHLLISMRPVRLSAIKVMAAHDSVPCQGEDHISSRPFSFI